MKDQQIKLNGLMSEGSIWKNLIFFSFPLLLGNLFQQLYNAVDSIVVGQFIGPEALAAVGSSASIINLLVSFFMGLSIGAGVVISRAFGAHQEEELRHAMGTSIAISIIAGIIMSILGVVFSPTILELMGTPADVMNNSVLYLRIYFLGVLSVMLYNMGSGILRALGDSKKPLYFLIVSSVTNIFLDILFVVYFNMGIAGAGWATLISQTISALLVLILLLKTKREYRLNIKDIKIFSPVFKDIIRIGLPSGVQNAVVSFSNVIVQSNINSFGSVAMAGCASYTKIDGFAILPVMSFSMALTTFISQNIGAVKTDRVKKGATIGLQLSLATTAVICVLLYVLGPYVLGIFSNDPQVIGYGLRMLHILVPGYLVLSVSHALAGILRGAGIANLPMIVMISCWCVLRMVWIFIAVPLTQNIDFVFLGWPITWLVSTIWLYWFYKRRRWVEEPINTTSSPSQ